MRSIGAYAQFVLRRRVAYKFFSYARERGVLLINIAEQIEPRDRL